MSKVKIIADDKIPFLKGALDSVAEVTYLQGNKISKEDIKEADALFIRTRTKCNAELLEGTAVRFIATATIGFDHIDTKFCKNNKIEWTNVPGCNSSSVEQYIVSALLEMGEKHSFNFKNKVIGIVGVGNVGTKVAKAAKALGMNVLLNDPPRQRNEGSNLFSSMEQVLAESDIISFHVPLNLDGVDKTFHMADEAFFSQMKKGVIIFNTSRGEVIDEIALKEALNKGKIEDSAIDVWENEPAIDTDLMNISGIVTPHIAGYSVEGKANGTMMSVRAVSRYFGLGLDDWKPSGLPGAEVQNIVIDCGGMDEQEIIKEVYNRTYDIMDDDYSFRKNPASFENLRGTYPVRREPSYFTFRLNNNPYERIGEVLENLGFTGLELDCFC
ncbi:MAG: 4-phosphoerythronate dehydrogenase [Bacteroidales bacterium]